MLELSQDGRERDAGEDVSVISLSGFESFALEFDWIKRAAGTKDASPARVLVSLGRRALGARRRVGEGENDRAIVSRGHVLQDGRSEGAADGRSAHDHAARKWISQVIICPLSYRHLHS